MNYVEITAHDGRIEVRSPYELREECRAAPGARWRPDRKRWMYPATPEIARQLMLRLRDVASIQPDAGFARLLEQAETAEAARRLKDRDDLPDWPSPTEAWGHQRQAFHFARNQAGTMLAMDMGVGKSKVAIGLLEDWHANRVLILCPRSVLSVWPGQFAAHASRHRWKVVMLRDGSIETRTQRAQLALDTIIPGAGTALILNYEAAWREPFRTWALRQQWDAVVLDESHRIKAPGGKQSLFCSRLRDAATRRLCLTGTPMPHSPLDIYSQYRFLEPGILGTSFARFRQRYAVMGGFQGRQVTGWQHEGELSERMGRIAYICDKADVLDLPPYQHVSRTCTLSPATRRGYDSMHRDFVTYLDDDEAVTAANSLAQLVRLSQITSGYLPSYRTGDPVPQQVGTEKRDLLADVLDDLALEEPIVIFARFRHDLDAARTVAAVRGRTVAELSGRADELELWQDGEADVLIVQIQSGGVGIDLSRARYAIYYSVDWSLGNYDQSAARLHRPGQERPVTYIHLVAEQTIDQTIYRALGARRKLVEAVIEAARGSADKAPATSAMIPAAGSDPASEAVKVRPTVSERG